MAPDPPTTSTEQQRLEADIRRIDAETAKLAAEKEEIEKRASSRSVPLAYWAGLAYWAIWCWARR